MFYVGQGPFNVGKSNKTVIVPYVSRHNDQNQGLGYFDYTCTSIHSCLEAIIVGVISLTICCEDIWNTNCRQSCGNDFL